MLRGSVSNLLSDCRSKIPSKSLDCILVTPCGVLQVLAELSSNKRDVWPCVHHCVHDPPDVLLVLFQVATRFVSYCRFQLFILSFDWNTFWLEVGRISRESHSV